MTTKQELLILAAAATVMFAIAPDAFADSLNQSGAGNVAQQDVGNTTIIGNGNNSPGSNSPHLTANGGRAKSSANSTAVGVGIAKGGSARAAGGNATSNSGGNTQTGGDQTTSIHYRATASTPGSNFSGVGDDTCSVGTGGGVGLIPVNLNFNTGREISNCFRLKFARDLDATGEHAVAKALRCQNEDVAAAYEAAGKECPGHVTPARRERTASMDGRYEAPDAPAVAFAGQTVDRSRYPSNTHNGW
jgi:hypothetical protein